MKRRLLFAYWAIALLLLAGLAARLAFAPAELRPYQGQGFSLELPEGWQVKVEERLPHVRIITLSSQKVGPIIIEEHPRSSQDPMAMAKRLENLEGEPRWVKLGEKDAVRAKARRPLLHLKDEGGEVLAPAREANFYFFRSERGGLVEASYELPKGYPMRPWRLEGTVKRMLESLAFP